MKLYGSLTSPFVRHVRVALSQSDLAYTFIEADYALSADQSPTAKVPYFENAGLKLTDSSSILKYVREQSGASFLGELEDFELYTMSSTLLDTAINLFLLEKEGATEQQFPYLARQRGRLHTGLRELNRRIHPTDSLTRDSSLRCACLIGWGLFRNRFALDGLENLGALMDWANQNESFANTAPR